MSITTMTTILIGDDPGAKKLEQKMPKSFFNMNNKLKDVREEETYISLSRN